MTKLIAVCFAVFVFAIAQPAHAQQSIFMDFAGLTTSDPNHKGYGKDQDENYVPVQWGNITAQCPECDTLANAYNQTMQSLLNTRYWIAEIEDRNEEIERSIREKRAYGGRGAPGEMLSEGEEKRAAEKMTYLMGLEDMTGRLPALHAQEESLTSLSQDLLAQLKDCEAQMCRKEPPKKKEPIKDKAASVLPFDWQGPYPEGCDKCAKLAARLNELPTLARHALAGLEASRAALMFAEVELLSIQAEHDAIGLDAIDRHNEETEGESLTEDEADKLQKAYHKQTKKRIAEMEAAKDKAERDIAKYESDLDSIIKNFNETLALYNECIPTCEKQTGSTDPVKTDAVAVGTAVETKPTFGAGCYAKLDLNESYLIGANSDYGTGAQMKNKAKDMATGAAMGALGNVLGKGISFGGGDGFDHDSSGGGSSGPDLDKNPLKGDFFRYNLNDLDIGTRAGFTDNGFLIDQKIFGSPDGNSTFHATWLQNELGQRILPEKYYIYDIYRDHKLTVWWTYDHWTNGVHDYHDEGSESTKWREDLGSFKLRFSGLDGMKNSMWYQSGFDTAVKGVKESGAYYNITPKDLAGCGLTAVTQFTLPKQDPVVTQPYFVNIRTPSEQDKERKEADGRLLNSLWMSAPNF